MVAGNKIGMLERLKEVSFLDGDFTLSSGKKSNVKFDLPRVQAYPDVQRELVSELKGIIDPRTDFIVGCMSGGALIGGVLAYEMGLKFCAVRGTEYPDEKRFEGKPPEKGDIVTLFDDVYTSGGTLRFATPFLLRRNIQDLHYLVILNRGEDSPSIDNLRVQYLLREEI